MKDRVHGRIVHAAALILVGDRFRHARLTALMFDAGNAVVNATLVGWSNPHDEDVE